MAIIKSAFGPSAISIRNAISGDRSLRSFKKADSACRVTPRALAVSVTLSPSGLMTSSRMISPGWGGLLIGLTPPAEPSVVVDEIDIKSSSLLETKDDSLIAGDGHAPETRQVRGESM
jgi:hypothetical protein